MQRQNILMICSDQHTPRVMGVTGDTIVSTPTLDALAAIRMKPVDRLPFWPKMDGTYPEAQGLPFREMSLDALHDWIGSDKHTGLPWWLREVRKQTSATSSREGFIARTVYRARGREVQLVSTFDSPSHSWHPVEFPIKTVEDIKLQYI